MSDAERPARDDTRAETPGPTDQRDTAWVEQAPTAPVPPDPDTVVLGGGPTRIDPHAAPPPGADPGWTAPGSNAPAWAPPPGAAPQPVAPSSPAPGWGSPPAPAPGWGPPTAPPPPGTPGAPGAWSGQALPGVAGWGAVPQAPKPGVIPLRPLGLGEILDASITYVRRDPRTVLGISFVIALVSAVLQFIPTYLVGASSFDVLLGPSDTVATDEVAQQLGQLYASAVLPALIGAVLQVVATGMLTVVMGQAVLGRRASMRQAWDRTRPRILALIGVTLLVGLVWGGTFVGGIALAVLLGSLVGSATDASVGVLAGVVLGLGTTLVAVWLFVRLLLAPAALILERVGVTRSMSRSMALVKGAWWRTFGIYLLASVLVQIVTSVLTFPIGLVAGLLPLAVGSDSVALVYAATTSLAVLVTSIITLPFLAGVTSLLYIDRRIRREALDLELQRAAGTGV